MILCFAKKLTNKELFLQGYKIRDVCTLKNSVHVLFGSCWVAVFQSAFQTGTESYANTWSMFGSLAAHEHLHKTPITHTHKNSHSHHISPPLNEIDEKWKGAYISKEQGTLWIRMHQTLPPSNPWLLVIRRQHLCHINEHPHAHAHTPTEGGKNGEQRHPERRTERAELNHDVKFMSRPYLLL